ncbi:MAG: spore coat U domain-containing protein [Nostoc sp.]
MMLRRFALASVLLIASSAAPAMAGSAPADIIVGATVINSCTITADPLDFGDYDPLVANKTLDLDVSADVKTTCTSGSTPNISLGRGLNDITGSALVPARRLKSGTTDYLAYNLHSGSVTGPIWGSGGIDPVADDGTEQTTTVFGRVPAGQVGIVVGTYADTVVATVNF